MHTVSKKTFIALESIIYVAQNSGAAPVCSKKLCEYQGLTLRYLEHILQALVHANILKGLRGPKGGYQIARDRKNISLCEVYDAIEQMEHIDDKSYVSKLRNNVIEPLWDKVEDGMREHLSSLTLQDLCERANETGVWQDDDSDEEKSHFNI